MPPGNFSAWSMEYSRTERYSLTWEKINLSASMRPVLESMSPDPFWWIWSPLPLVCMTLVQIHLENLLIPFTLEPPEFSQLIKKEQAEEDNFNYKKQKNNPKIKQININLYYITCFCKPSIEFPIVSSWVRTLFNSRSYGIMVSFSDNQGLWFYLGCIKSCTLLFQSV